jgi:uridine kinase
VIKQALRAAGLEPAVITLDHWIVDQAGRRPEFTVRQRFDGGAIGQFWERAVRHPGTAVRLPRYDRYSGSVVPDAVEFVYRPDQVLIVDGVLALDIPELARDASLTIYVQADEQVRRDRFLREYRLRGRTPQQAESLYRQRRGEEGPVVEAGKQRATIIWEDDR